MIHNSVSIRYRYFNTWYVRQMVWDVFILSVHACSERNVTGWPSALPRWKDALPTSSISGCSKSPGTSSRCHISRGTCRSIHERWPTHLSLSGILTLFLPTFCHICLTSFKFEINIWTFKFNLNNILS